MNHCSGCSSNACSVCAGYCDACQEYICSNDDCDDLKHHEKPLVRESSKKNGEFIDERCDSNCDECRSQYAFMGYDEFKQREKAARLALQYTILLAKGRFNETYRLMSASPPSNRSGTTKESLNGELALFIIGSDDMWRAVAEFL